MASEGFGDTVVAQPSKPSTEDYAIAKFLRFKVPIHQGKLQGIDVKCFFAEDAVNLLMDSKWATGPDCRFTDRQSCVDFCHRLLCYELFHRAKLVKKPDGVGRPPIAAIRKKLAEKAGSMEDEDASAAAKKKKKLKLDMHNSQRFVDGQEVFVWIYDPTPAKHFIIGFLLVFGTIAFVLFPLWPPGLRRVAYYSSWVGIALLAVLFGLVAMRYVMFLVLWLITGGRRHFWLLPNLLKDDCGLTESFTPFYTHRVVEPGSAAAAAAASAAAGDAGGRPEAADDDDGSAEHDPSASNDEELLDEEQDAEEGDETEEGAVRKRQPKKTAEELEVDEEERALRRQEREQSRRDKRAELAARRAQLAEDRRGISKKERRRRRALEDDDEDVADEQVEAGGSDALASVPRGGGGGSESDDPKVHDSKSEVENEAGSDVLTERVEDVKKGARVSRDDDDDGDAKDAESEDDDGSAVQSKSKSKRGAKAGKQKQSGRSGKLRRE